MDAQYPNDIRGKEILDKYLAKVKKLSRNRPYDCVIGVSGGRDSTYLLHKAVEWGLRPLAVHFNDGFGNPIAGENMTKITSKLGIDLRVVTSDWRESKDLRISFLKASTPDIEQSTDLGIATALYGQAAKEDIKCVLLGHSFRTEGIAPLEWSYLDGKYLDSVHKKFGSVKLRPWKANDPGFHLGWPHIFYYSILRGIRVFTPFFYIDYVRKEAEKIISNHYEWVYPGAHYYDDLYQAFMTRIYRIKFNIDRRKFNYAALVRSGQMTRTEALEKLSNISLIEDPEIIDLVEKRLGLSTQELNEIMELPIKTFRDYDTSFNLIMKLKLPIKILSKMNFLPTSTYIKYFECN